MRRPRFLLVTLCVNCAREGLRGHRAAHVPVPRRGRDGHRRSRPRRERTYLAAAATVPHDADGLCPRVGCVPSAARTPFPVIGSCVKMSEFNFNTPRRHQLAAQTYHTLRPIIELVDTIPQSISRRAASCGGCTAVALLEDLVVVAVARAAAFLCRLGRRRLRAVAARLSADSAVRVPSAQSSNGNDVRGVAALIE